MRKKTWYTLLALLVVAAGYWLETKGVDRESYLEQLHVDWGGNTSKNDTIYQDGSHFLPSSTTGQIIHHKGYSLSYSEPHEQAEWVAYKLEKEHLSGVDYKRPYFEMDDAVISGSANWRNYKDSGYDRGHLCPAADRKFSKEAFTETFLTSNVSPQEHQFNSGIWNRLEQKVRFWASRYDGVYVVTGGILKEIDITIGEEQVAVPKQFYKIVLDYNSGNPKVIAFLSPHEESDTPLYYFVVTVESLEVISGIDFFPSMDDDVENRIEAFEKWENWHF